MATATAPSILARGRGRGDLEERDRPREGRLSPVFVFLKEDITYLRIELSNVCSPLRKVGGQGGNGGEGSRESWTREVERRRREERLRRSCPREK